MDVNICKTVRVMMIYDKSTGGMAVEISIKLDK